VSRFDEKVRKFVSRAQQDLPASEIPVQLTCGPASFSDSLASIPLDSKALEHAATLRGPKSAVEDLAKKLEVFIEAEKQDELDRGHVTSFEFPFKYANYLIGKKGENINNYREEFDVEIQVNDGKVEIKGPEAKAELAKSKILALRKKLENEVSYVLKINPQYHRDMIGAKGNQVNRLQDRYNVRIQFPRAAHAGNEDRSSADGGSEVGGSRTARTSQAADEVIIRGPKKGADEAKDELLSLLQWTIDNSHVSTVSVAQNQLPSLIGQGGREVENLRLATGAQIDVPGHRDAADSSGRMQIRIKGTKKQVEEAKKQLEQRAKVFDNSITKTIQVDKKYHKALIGSGGKFQHA
jgi:predicted PilT family ATPase